MQDEVVGKPYQVVVELVQVVQAVDLVQVAQQALETPPQQLQLKELMVVRNHLIQQAVVVEPQLQVLMVLQEVQLVQVVQGQLLL